MVWIATVPHNASVPIDQVHVALYAYFPDLGADAPRPYVWRLLSPSTILLMSSIRPSAPTAREVRAEEGMTYEFAATIRRTRNVQPCLVTDDGTRVRGAARTVEMTDPIEIRERVRSFVAGRGGSIRFVRAENFRALQMGRKRLPLCDVIGKVTVTSGEAFDGFLAAGGPGTGKAYGAGLWHLPEIMGEAA